MEAEVQRKKESRGYKGRLGAKDGGADRGGWGPTKEVAKEVGVCSVNFKWIHKMCLKISN